MVSHRRILGTYDDSTNICLLCLAIALETGTYGTENKNHADVCFFKLTTTTILVDFFVHLRGRGFSFLFSFPSFLPFVDLETGYGHGAATRFL